MLFYQSKALHIPIFFRIFAVWKQQSKPTAVRSWPSSISRPSVPAQRGPSCASTCMTIPSCTICWPAGAAPFSPSRCRLSSTPSAAPRHQSLELARLLPTGRKNPALSRDKAGLFSNKAGLLDSGQYWTVEL